MSQEIQTATPPKFEPAVDVLENDGGLLLLADLPGVERADLHVEVKDGALRFEAKRGAEAVYVRSFRLPNTVDLEKITVTLADGVARFELPKHERAKPHRIPVN